ncbi:oligosaccharide flippase family protein [Patescibacteria group bacterium]|nr:oligosaccharide flippase family protein [Patescibacteria group bacterium]
MFNQIKRLFKHSFIYLIGSALQSLIGFVLIPVYTRYLSPAEYGQLEILNTILLILNIVLSLGFASALLKVHERDCQEKEERRRLIGTMYIFVLPIASAVTLLLALGAKFFTGFVLEDASSVSWLYLILATNLVVIFLNLSFSVLRSKERSKTFTLLSLVKFTFILALNTFFVIKLQLGVMGILLGNLIAQTILAVIFLPTILRSLKFTFSRKYLRKLSIFGLAVIPASLAMWVMDLSDRYFLKYFTDFTEVGLYSLGYKVGFLVYILLVYPFQLAWPKVSFAVASRQDCKEIYAKTLTYFALLGSLAALGLSLFGAQIIKLFADPEFHTAYQIIPLVAFSYVLYGLHFALVPGLHLKEKSKYYPLMIGIPAGLNLLLNYFLVPLYGMQGAAVTTLICFILVVVLTYLITQQFYRVRYEWGRLAKLMMLVLVVLALKYYLNTSSLAWLDWLGNVLLLLVFVLGIWAIRFFTPEERNKIRSIIRR